MESQPSIPNPTTKAIPEDPFEKPLRDVPPRKTPFGALRRVPRVPEARPRNPFGAFPKPAERPLSKPPFEPSFGARHVSRKPAQKPPLRNLLRNPFGLSFGECHASRSPHREPNREIPHPPSGCFPKETPVPECLSRKTPSRIFFEPATC